VDPDSRQNGDTANPAQLAVTQLSLRESGCALQRQTLSLLVVVHLGGGGQDIMEYNSD
jgi:hypothetical protein